MTESSVQNACSSNLQKKIEKTFNICIQSKNKQKNIYSSNKNQYSYKVRVWLLEIIKKLAVIWEHSARGFNLQF